MNIQDVTRAMSVKRFHIVETSRPMTLAEHGFLVSMVAVELVERMDVESAQLAYHAMWWGMMHDLDEIVDGDIPTPTKEKNGIDSHPQGYDYVPESVRKIVKIAELITDAWFVRDYGVGRHATSVAQDCENRLESYVSSLPAEDAKLKIIARRTWHQICTGDFEI